MSTEQNTLWDVLYAYIVRGLVIFGAASFMFFLGVGVGYKWGQSGGFFVDKKQDQTVCGSCRRSGAK